MVDSVQDALVETGAATVGAPVNAEGHRPPLRLREKALYATGDVCEGSINVAIGNFFLFYLTAVCGLSGSLAGLALFLTLLVDSLLDPFVGYISDNTKTRLGRRHPYLLFSALPLALTFGLLFAIPEGLRGYALFAYVVVVLLAERVLHSAFLLPYAALGAELTSDYKERSSIGAWRTFFNITANLTVITLGYGIFKLGGQGTARSAYAIFGWSMAAVVLVFAMVCFSGTLRLRGRLHEHAEPQRLDPRKFAGEVVEVARNKSFRTLFFAIIVFWIAQGTAGTLALHANRFFWGLQPQTIQLVLMFGLAGAVTGIPIAALILHRLEKQWVCLGSVAAFCLLQFTPAALRVAGLLPLEGTALQAFLSGVQVVTGWSTTALAVSFLAMMADIADEHEFLYGSRREALYFAGSLFSTKASIAIGALIGGVSLDLIGFPKEVAKLGAHPLIAPDTVRNLGLMTGPGAAIIAAVAVALLAGYSLNAERVADIQSELARRRAARAAVG
jgi:GPH family glycoside/pentoside/hexuronide:cation symporter